MAQNFMQFTCNLSRSEQRARKTKNETVITSTQHAITRAREAYQRKDYVSAEQWRNAAERSSLQMC